MKDSDNKNSRTLSGSFYLYLHFLRCGDTDDAERNGDNTADAVSQQQTCFHQLRLHILDAADGVEAVETGCKLGNVLVDAAGVVVAGSQTDFLGQQSQLLDKLVLGIGAALLP